MRSARRITLPGQRPAPCTRAWRVLPPADGAGVPSPALAVVGTLLWVGPIVGLGYAVGKPAADVVHPIDHYSTLRTIVFMPVEIGIRSRRRRRAIW